VGVDGGDLLSRNILMYGGTEKKKGKVIPLHATEAHGEEEV
jgi:hypothetical protein